jgi:hypothetical protein
MSEERLDFENDIKKEKMRGIRDDVMIDLLTELISLDSFNYKNNMKILILIIDIFIILSLVV